MFIITTDTQQRNISDNIVDYLNAQPSPNLLNWLKYPHLEAAGSMLF